MSEIAVISAAELFSRHAGFVATFLRRLGAAIADVDDLVQETFLVAHQRGGFTPDRAKATTWLAAIALRVYSNHRRTARRRPTHELNVEIQAKQNVVAQLEARSSLHRVQQALSTLDTEHRAVFILFELQEQNCQDIALALEVPLGTVYSRLHNARKKFLRSYDELTNAVSPLLACEGISS